MGRSIAAGWTTVKAAFWLEKGSPGRNAGRILGASYDRLPGLGARVARAIALAHDLLDAANRYGVPDSRGVLIGIKYTHQEIADYVGSTRETVTLTLGELKRRNLVLFDHRRIVVRDAEALAATIE